MRARIRRIFENTKKPVDRIALVNATEPHLDLSFFYATGLKTGLFEGSAAILRPPSSLEVIVPQLEEDIAVAAGLRVRAYRTRDQFRALLVRRLKGVRRLGINGEELTYQSYRELKAAARGARLVDVGEALRAARVVKDPQELQLMRRAADIASRAFEDTLEVIRPGRREYEVAADLNHAMQQRGASGPSFTTIVASGPNSALPHHTAGERRLRRGDFVVIDFGASYRRYASDVTRTVVVGRATAKHREIYGVVARAQEEARAAVREGAKGSDVDRIARDIIDSTRYKGRFIHGLGHSLGLAVHDAGGGLGPTSRLVLRRGMVMTVEPGIYLPRFGGVRIEDDVVVRGRGPPEVMSDAPRELLSLG